MSPYILLDPDGTQRHFDLFVVVLASTGVVYAHQCDGLRTDVREAEGFLVPVGGAGDPAGAEVEGPLPTIDAGPLVAFFARVFQGHPPDPRRPQDGTWTAAQLGELAALVRAIPCWQTARAVEGTCRLFLELDTDRLDELTEAWVPVRTAYGPGILVFPNSD